jgi:hypothetical protein
MKVLHPLLMFGACLLVSLPAITGELSPADLLKPVLAESWVRVGEPKRYSPDDLFEYIDGEAEHFVAYGFRQAAVAEYQSKTDPKRKLTVDVYDQGSSAQAFGFYSSMRSGDVKYVDVGAQGYVAGPVLDFWKGRYFVHLYSAARFAEFEDTALRLGRELASGITGESGLPAVCALLPKEGLLPNSVRWFRQDFLGHAFLKDAAVAEYGREKRRWQLFIISHGTRAEALKSLELYRGAALKRAERLETPGGLPKDTVVVRQPYYEVIALAPAGRYLVGAMRVPDTAAAASVLSPVIAALGARK